LGAEPGAELAVFEVVHTAIESAAASIIE